MLSRAKAGFLHVQFSGNLWSMPHSLGKTALQVCIQGYRKQVLDLQGHRFKEPESLEARNYHITVTATITDNICSFPLFQNLRQPHHHYQNLPLCDVHVGKVLILNCLGDNPYFSASLFCPDIQRHKLPALLL